MKELKGMDNNFRKLVDIMDRHEVVILRYEEFFNNFNVVYDMLLSRLNISVSSKLRKQIDEECSLEANRRRSYSKRTEWETTRIGSCHVGIGTPGMWKLFIPLWGYDLIQKWCDPLCKEWDYEIDDVRNLP